VALTGFRTILSAENGEKSLGGQLGLRSNPAGELIALPQTSDVV